MNKNLLIAGAIVAAITAATAFFPFGSGEKQSDGAFINPSDQTLVAQGKNIYAAQCAACHGANLEGQPEWRQRMANGRLPAPPHDPSGHTWHHPDAVLFDIVKNGLVPGKTAPEGYESDMPAYGKMLSDADIVAVLAYIQSTWPPEVLEMQKKLSKEQGRK